MGRRYGRKLGVLRTWKGVHGWLLFSVVLVSMCQTARSQFPELTDQPADTSISRRDTLRTPPVTPFVRPLEESSSRPSGVKGYTSTKSPGIAVLLSAVAPGVGQIYNESYWKPPIIWSLGGYWVYEWVTLNDKYQDFRTQFAQNPSNDQLKRIRDFYRDERDKFAWYLGALYFVNLLDAYVGASLYDFNVTPDLTADGVIVPKITATLRLRF